MNLMVEKIKTRKLTFALVVVGVLVVATFAVGTFLAHDNVEGVDGKLAPINISQSTMLAKTSQCHVGDTAIKAQVERQDGLSEETGPWTSHIYDVPAGTNVEVNVATYDEDDTITGSLIYPKQYGSYNFTLTKQGDDWGYTQFTGCY